MRSSCSGPRSLFIAPAAQIDCHGRNEPARRTVSRPTGVVKLAGLSNRGACQTSGLGLPNAAAFGTNAGRWADIIAQRREGLPCRSEEHTSELQSLMRISYAVFCLK